MNLTPWSELERPFLTPSHVRQVQAEARPSIVVECQRFHEDGAPSIVFIRGPRGRNVHARGTTIAGARQRVRAELAAVSRQDQVCPLSGVPVPR